MFNLRHIFINFLQFINSFFSVALNLDSQLRNFLMRLVHEIHIDSKVHQCFFKVLVKFPLSFEEFAVISCEVH